MNAFFVGPPGPRKHRPVRAPTQCCRRSRATLPMLLCSSGHAPFDHVPAQLSIMRPLPLQAFRSPSIRFSYLSKDFAFMGQARFAFYSFPSTIVAVGFLQRGLAPWMESTHHWCSHAWHVHHNFFSMCESPCLTNATSRERVDSIGCVICARFYLIATQLREGTSPFHAWNCDSMWSWVAKRTLEKMLCRMQVAVIPLKKARYPSACGRSDGGGMQSFRKNLSVAGVHFQHE